MVTSTLCAIASSKSPLDPIAVSGVPLRGMSWLGRLTRKRRISELERENRDLRLENVELRGRLSIETEQNEILRSDKRPGGGLTWLVGRAQELTQTVKGGLVNGDGVVKNGTVSSWVRRARSRKPNADGAPSVNHTKPNANAKPKAKPNASAKPNANVKPQSSGPARKPATQKPLRGKDKRKT